MKSLTCLVLVSIVVAVYAGTTITVGPGKQYASPQAASAALANDVTMVIDDGTYTGAFNINPGLTGVTIMSASGNPYACVLDGQGGGDGQYRLSWGKGIIHTQSPITVHGVGFVRGGGSDNVGSGEAGLYAELFSSPGTVSIINCAFDQNENGIFVPSALPGNPGVNVSVYLEACIFSRIAGNGVTSDGLSHNYYINGVLLHSVNCTHLPSVYGNNGKSRSLTTTIKDLYNKHNQGRCLDIPSGGQFTMEGGVYTSVGPSAVSNFMEYAAENTASGLYNPTTTGITLVCARSSDTVWNAATGYVWTFTNIVQQWADTSLSLNLEGGGTFSGITASAPQGAQTVSIPAPIYPAWATNLPTSAPTLAPTMPPTLAPVPTAAPGSGPTLLVGPTRTYTDPAVAAQYLAPGGTLLLDDGTYQTHFDINDTLGIVTIKSASGNPYACILDGQGGVGSGHRLSWGKGIIHARSPAIIQGIGFINGGGGDNVGDGEAGLYAELFDGYGELNVINCAFDGCENGIFVPSGAPIKVVLEGCVFSKNSPNGVTSDGLSHNYYLSGAELVSVDCTHLPSKYGNNGKSRSLVASIYDLYNKHDQGRCLDIPSGGQLHVEGGVYTPVGPTAVSNFLEYGMENNAAGFYDVTANGLTIVNGRYNDAIVMAPSANKWTFTNINQEWVSGAGGLNLEGNIVGLVASQPQGASTVNIPDPIYPPWVTGTVTTGYTLPSTTVASSSTAANNGGSTTAANNGGSTTAASTTAANNGGSTTTAATSAQATTAHQTTTSASATTTKPGSTTATAASGSTTASGTSAATATPKPTSSTTANQEAAAFKVSAGSFLFVFFVVFVILF